VRRVSWPLGESLTRWSIRDSMPEFVIRRATAADASILARHRAEMFREMGVVQPSLYQDLVDASRAYFEEAIPAERYVGWVCECSSPSGTIVGGAGAQLRELAPRPDSSGARLARGPECYVLNVFTEQAWRRQGVAERLMRELMQWAAGLGIERLSLHASNEGRTVYEKLGFVATNEMRREATIKRA
jgi:GNAT superfamily N-acetyltransferase